MEPNINQFPSKRCAKCGAPVKRGEGIVTGKNAKTGRWIIQHQICDRDLEQEPAEQNTIKAPEEQERDWETPKYEGDIDKHA